MEKTIVLKKLDKGCSICVDLDDLLDMMRRVAKENNIDLNAASTEDKRKILRMMGYEPYFEILKKEVEFQWL